MQQRAALAITTACSNKKYLACYLFLIRGWGHELMLFGGGFLVHVDGQMDGPGFCRHQLI